jgi:hypothetical protein
MQENHQHRFTGRNLMDLDPIRNEAPAMRQAA